MFLPLGADHLLFLLCLYLGCQNRRQLVVLISWFTLAHSISLAAAAYQAGAGANGSGWRR